MFIIKVYVSMEWMEWNGWRARAEHNTAQHSTAQHQHQHQHKSLEFCWSLNPSEKYIHVHYDNVLSCLALPGPCHGPLPSLFSFLQMDFWHWKAQTQYIWQIFLSICKQKSQANKLLLKSEIKTMHQCHWMESCHCYVRLHVMYWIEMKCQAMNNTLNFLLLIWLGLSLDGPTANVLLLWL